MSRTAGLWTGIKVVTSVADGSATADVGPGRIEPVIPTFEWRGKPYRPRTTGQLVGAVANAVEEEIYEARLPLALLYGIENRLNRITVDAPDAWLGIIASGRNYHETIEALQLLGLDHAGLARNGVRLLQMSMIHPFEGSVARHFASGLQEILVIEEKRPFIETHLRDALYGMPDAPTITGKKDPDGAYLIPTYGALEADKLVEPLRRRLSTRIDASRLVPPPAPVEVRRDLIQLLPTRTPYYCSGCPHSTGTKAPEDALVGTGIGCHGLANLMEPSMVGQLMGNTQMGGRVCSGSASSRSWAPSTSSRTWVTGPSPTPARCACGRRWRRGRT
jgi:indolepyruvate ferredoxin oxidoreductase